MARLTVDGGDLVLQLAWWERMVTRTGQVRVALTAVWSVEIQPEPWRALRGVREKGLLIRDVLCLGVWRHPGGRDFVAVRPRGSGVVCVELRRPSPFARIAVQSAQAPQAVAKLRTAVGNARVADALGESGGPVRDGG